jgi:putative transcriptional regulator
MPVRVTLDVMLARRKLRARDVAEQIGLSETQLSLLRTGKVRGMRFGTLSKLCHVLECVPGDILEYDRNDADLVSDDDAIRAGGDPHK